MIEDAPLLTKTVKINQSEGIPGSGILERTFVKNSYKRFRTSLPSPPLLCIAFFNPHRSPLSERLEQAIKRSSDTRAHSGALCNHIHAAGAEELSPQELANGRCRRTKLAEGCYSKWTSVPPWGPLGDKARGLARSLF